MVSQKSLLSNHLLHTLSRLGQNAFSLGQIRSVNGQFSFALMGFLCPNQTAAVRECRMGAVVHA